jgi:hypothetical protein
MGKTPAALQNNVGFFAKNPQRLGQGILFVAATRLVNRCRLGPSENLLEGRIIA